MTIRDSDTELLILGHTLGHIQGRVVTQLVKKLKQS
jgi:hypothetical protein